MTEEVRIDEFKSEILSLLRHDKTTVLYDQSAKQTSNEGSKPDITFSCLLKELVHSHFDEDDAMSHWKNILENYNVLRTSLGRDVGIKLAAYDYFINGSSLFKETVLVDQGFIRRLRHSTLIDPLTNAFNRSYFELHLKKELKRAIRYNRVFSLLLFDVDDFKTLNESRGHEFCDELVVRLVKLLKDSCREEDVLCRFGLEEFIFFLPETSAEGAFHFAERIRYSIKEHDFFSANSVSVSGGIAEYPHDSRNIFNLIKCADSALYLAKSRGKDKVSFYKEKNELATIYDGLTGLFNHTHFESLLIKENSRAVRHGLAYSVLLLDIDRFNRVNNEEGAVFGDLALTQFSCLLAGKCRDLDVLARIGGGQFVFLLPETDAEAAFAFAERLRESIIDKCSFNDYKFTFSCGVASYPFDGFDYREVMDFARKACVQAAKEGGNRVVRYTGNRRAAKRFRKSIRVKYRLLDAAFSDAKPREFVTEDVSLHGLRFVAADQFEIDTELLLYFKGQHSKDGPLVIIGKIVWMKPLGKTGSMYGLMFHDAGERCVDFIREIIKTGEESENQTV